MKKNNLKLFVKTILFAFTLLALPGCKEVTPEIDVYDTNYDHTFWVKLNNSYLDVDAQQTGYISSTSLREANPYDDIEADSPASVDFETLYKSQKKDYLPIDNINNSIMEEMTNDLISVGRNSIPTPIPCEPTEDNYKVGDEKELFVLLSYEEDNVQKSKIESYTGKCEYSSDICNVWFIDNCELLKEKELLDINYFANLAEKFEKIIELEENLICSHIYTTKLSENYADPSKKVNLVIYDIDNDAVPTWNLRTYGYTWYNDFQNSDYSNKGAYIYLDSHIGFLYPNDMYSTIIHEYNHYLIFANKVVQNNCNFQSWYTEMLSLTMEDIFQDYIDISEAASSQNRLPLFNQYYYAGFTNWRNNEGDYVLASYANAYAFGAYLFRNFGGFELLSQITKNEYTNEQSINEALKACNQTYIDKNGNEQYVDFNYLLENFYKVLFNNKPATEVSNKQYLTLNKEIHNSTNELHFHAIDLYKLSDINIYNQDGSESKPTIFTATKEGQIPIGANGFSLHHVGAQLKSYNYVKPSTDRIKSIFFSTFWNDTL